MMTPLKALMLQCVYTAFQHGTLLQLSSNWAGTTVEGELPVAEFLPVFRNRGVNLWLVWLCNSQLG